VAKDDDDIERALGNFHARLFGKFGSEKPKKPDVDQDDNFVSLREAIKRVERIGARVKSELDDVEPGAVDEESFWKTDSFWTESSYSSPGAKTSVPSVKAKGGPDPNFFSEVEPASPFDLFAAKPKWLAWRNDKAWCTKCNRAIEGATIAVRPEETMEHFSSRDGVRVRDNLIVVSNEYILKVECHGWRLELSSAAGILSSQFISGEYNQERGND
jgi:hypothetical protein